MKAAIIYYSKSGNTKKIAEAVQKQFSADGFFVEPQKAYGSYLSAVLRYGKEKMLNRSIPLVQKKNDFSGYDVLFVGFPVWYGTMPSFMQEYLKGSQISGKIIIPFATAASNGREKSLQTVQQLFSNCTVTNYFYTSQSDKGNMEAWLKQVSERLKSI